MWTAQDLLIKKDLKKVLKKKEAVNSSQWRQDPNKILYDEKT